MKEVKSRPYAIESTLPHSEGVSPQTTLLLNYLVQSICKT